MESFQQLYRQTYADLRWTESEDKELKPTQLISFNTKIINSTLYDRSLIHAYINLHLLTVTVVHEWPGSYDAFFFRQTEVTDSASVMFPLRCGHLG